MKFLIALLLLVCTSSAHGSELFPVYNLQPTVNFWVHVFSEQSKDDVVIHCADHLPTLDGALTASFTERTSRYTRRQTIAQLKTQYKKLNPSCKDIRSQTGIRERTNHALEISKTLLPKMEQIFLDMGLPIELTRLPFLESSFNNKARSKVGALGLWQFMPSSARLFGLHVSKKNDHRYDPILSTHAAARHLQDNYNNLNNNWPLAVVAYNHGQAGIRRGLRKTGGTTIDDLIDNYNSRSFKFASKNFYAEFLAVVQIYNNYQLCNQ